MWGASTNGAGFGTADGSRNGLKLETEHSTPSVSKRFSMHIHLSNGQLSSESALATINWLSSAWNQLGAWNPKRFRPHFASSRRGKRESNRSPAYTTSTTCP